MPRVNECVFLMLSNSLAEFPKMRLTVIIKYKITYDRHTTFSSLLVFGLLRAVTQETIKAGRHDTADVA